MKNNGSPIPNWLDQIAATFRAIAFEELKDDIKKE
jgi:hypothetical protein